MNKEQEMKSSGPLSAVLNGLEKLGNLLPTPLMIFTFLFVFTAVVSMILNLTGFSATNPNTQEVVTVQNFFSVAGLHWLLSNLVKNFTGFAPLGMVLVMSIGVGLCEEVGLLNHLINKSLKDLPAALLPYLTICIGVVGQVASDSAQYIIPPLAGALYYSKKRNPIVGVLTAFTGVGLGYLGNPLFTTTDVLATGITNTALKAMGTGLSVDVTANYYFKVISFVFIGLVLGFISDKFVEPRFGALDYSKAKAAPAGAFVETDAQRKGLRVAGIGVLLYIALIVVGMMTPGVLLHEKTGLLGSMFLSGIVPIMWGLFMVSGLAYGFASGFLKGEASIAKALTKRMATMAGYIVMAFMMGQFMALFDWTKLGTILSIKGAIALEEANFTGFPLILSFIIFVVILDFLMSSASAKWTLLAPVFVPMLVYLGYHPAFIQVAYRIGDAGANIMGPTNAFLWMLLAHCQEQYDPNLKFGKFLSTQMIFTVCSQIGWWIILFIFVQFNLQIGPGVSTLL